MEINEQTELSDLKANIQAAKMQSIAYMIHLSRCSERELTISGHSKGLGEALVTVVNKLNKDIEKLTKAFIKKYPDEGVK